MTSSTAVEKVPAGDVAVGDQIASKKKGPFDTVTEIQPGAKSNRLVMKSGNLRPRHTTGVFRLKAQAEAASKKGTPTQLPTAKELAAKVAAEKADAPKPTRTNRRRKPARCTEQDQATAQAAQKKAQPAAKITGPNIATLRKALDGRTPTEATGISARTLGDLATGKKRLSEVKDGDQRAAFKDLGATCGRDTFYGQKFAGMLWAISREQQD